MGMANIWDEEHTYIVEGAGEFPFDMLRRDRSFPADSESAANMNGNTSCSNRQVKLIATRARDIAVKRWESFGWKVIAGFADTLPMSPVDGQPFDVWKHLSG